MNSIALNFNPPLSHLYWNKFIQELSVANVSYGDYHFFDCGNLVKDIGCLFNRAHSPEYYRTKIDELYIHAVEELWQHTTRARIKAEQLQLIGQWYAELLATKTLLTQDDHGYLKHRRFNLVDESTDKQGSSCTSDQSKYQGYYAILMAVAVRMESHLNSMKEVTVNSNQSELDTAYYQSLNESVSTSRKPLQHFEYLLSTDALKQRKDEFNAGKIFEDDAYIIYNEHTNIYSLHRHDPDFDNWVVEEFSFDELLKEHVSNECQKSQQLINQYISELDDPDSISSYLGEVLSQIRSQTNNLIGTTDQIEHQIIAYGLITIEELLTTKYGNYLRNIPTALSETTISQPQLYAQVQQPTTQLYSTTGVMSFKWKHDPTDGLSLLLHHELIDNEFIHPSTTLNTLHLAFSGINLSAPLNIIWTAKGKNGMVNKKLLIYLLSSLAGADLILEDTDQITWIKQIQYIFCDEGTTPIKNLDVSVASKDGKRKTNQQEVVDRVIGKLRQIVAK